jgi:hypothetical protein
VVGALVTPGAVELRGGPPLAKYIMSGAEEVLQPKNVVWVVSFEEINSLVVFGIGGKEYADGKKVVRFWLAIIELPSAHADEFPSCMVRYYQRCSKSISCSHLTASIAKITSNFRALTNIGCNGITSPSSPPSTIFKTVCEESINVSLATPWNGLGYLQTSSSTPGCGRVAFMNPIMGPIGELANPAA